MGEQGQPPGVVRTGAVTMGVRRGAQVAQEYVDQPGFEGDPGACGRLFHGVAKLGSGHRPYDNGLFTQGGDELRYGHALRVEVGTDPDGDQGRRSVLVAVGQGVQRPDEGFAEVGAPAEGEDLLELVDDDDQRRTAVMAPQFGRQAQRIVGQGRRQALGGYAGGTGQGLGERGRWIGGRGEQQAGPGGGGGDAQLSSTEGGEQSGAQQRGLARAGGAEHGQDAPVVVAAAEGVDEDTGEVLPAEEPRGVGRFEGGEPFVGAGVDARGSRGGQGAGARSRRSRRSGPVGGVGGDDELARSALTQVPGPGEAGGGEFPLEVSKGVVEGDVGRAGRVAGGQQSPEGAAERGVPLALRREGELVAPGGGQDVRARDPGQRHDLVDAAQKRRGPAGEAAVEDDHEASAGSAVEVLLEAVPDGGVGQGRVRQPGGPGVGGAGREVQEPFVAHEAVTDVVDDEQAVGALGGGRDGVPHLQRCGGIQHAGDRFGGDAALLDIGLGEIREGAGPGCV